MRSARYAWVVVGLLWAVALFNYLDRQIITTMKAPIIADLSISNSQFGLFMSVFLWIYGILSPMAGLVADRLNKRWVIIGSLAVWSAVTWATGHVHSLEQMMVCRALMGISEAFYVPAAVALIVEYHQGRTRSLATGLHISGMYTGSMIGGVGGTLATHFNSWRPVFSLFGGIGVGYAVVLLLALRGGAARAAGGQGADGRPSLAESLRSLLTTRGFLLLLAMNAVVGAAMWTLKGWLPPFFQEEMGKSQSEAGWYGTLFFNGAAFAGMLVGGLWSDRWSRVTLRARPLVPAIGFLIAGPIFFGCVALSQAAMVVVFGVLCVGFGQGCLDSNLMPTVCTLTDKSRRATAYGLLNFVGTTTGGLMTYYAGHLKDAHVPFAASFQVGAAMIFVAGLLLLAVKPKLGEET
jgi:MFS family permease